MATYDYFWHSDIFMQPKANVLHIPFSHDWEPCISSQSLNLAMKSDMPANTHLQQVSCYLHPHLRRLLHRRYRGHPLRFLDQYQHQTVFHAKCYFLCKATHSAFSGYLLNEAEEAAVGLVEDGLEVFVSCESARLRLARRSAVLSSASTTQSAGILSGKS